MAVRMTRVRDIIASIAALVLIVLLAAAASAALGWNIPVLNAIGKMMGLGS